MTQKQTLSQNEHPGLWLYNLLMTDLAPDLCSNNIDNLDDLYEGESEIDERARLEGYEKAFEDFDHIIKMMKDVRIEDAQETKKEMKNKLKAQETSEQKEELSAADEQLDIFDA